MKTTLFIPTLALVLSLSACNNVPKETTSTEPQTILIKAIRHKMDIHQIVHYRHLGMFVLMEGLV